MAELNSAFYLPGSQYLRLRHSSWHWRKLVLNGMLIDIKLRALESHKRKLIRCQVAIKGGPALLELRLLHGSKLWQLAIDTHFSRCFKPLSHLPKFAFDLDDARYSTVHLSTIAKVAIGSGSFEIPVSILDDVEEKINILFPLSRNTSADARREITTAVMKAQNQLVLEVLRRHQHLEAADQQVQRALAAMTERALAAERHAESLHAIVVEIEDVLPQFTLQMQLQQQQQQRQHDQLSSSASFVHLPPPTEPAVDHPPNRSGSSTPTGLGTISWRKKVELLEDELQKKQTTLERCQRELREQQHLPAFQSKIDQLQQENRLLREMTATLRAEIVALTDQLQEIQQAALAEIETMHEQNPALAEEAAVTLRRSLDASDRHPLLASPPRSSSSPPMRSHESTASYRVSVDLSAFNASGGGAAAAASSPSATLHASAGSIFRQPLDLDALSESQPGDHRAYDRHGAHRHGERHAPYGIDDGDGDEQYEEAKAPHDRARREHDAVLARLQEAEEDYDGDDVDGPLPTTLERDNWTNKYHAYIQQLSATGDGASASSSNGALQELITSLGWSLVEERLLTQLFWQYVHAGHVPGASFSQTHGMSLTKFQKFLKDFHMLAIHPTTPLSAAEQAGGGGGGGGGGHTHRSSAAHFTAAYTSGAAFKVHGGHRSAADALDFYHTQHLHGPQPYHQHRFGPAYHHADDATAATMDASTAAAFAVGHPGGVGVAVGVVNPASALLSLPQFRYALTLVAEKLYARVLQQATGVAPVTLTGKDRVQAIRAMFELLWVRNLSPIARSLDLVPHALSALRVFLVHVHSEAQDLAVALAATPLAGAFPWPQYLPQVEAFFAQRPAPLASMRFALLQSLCTPEHLQLLASLYRTFTSSSTTTTVKPTTTSMVMEPLGMAQVVRPLQAHAYLWHPFNHLPRLAMTFAHFRRLCLAQGLLPYLIGEHQLYALFQEVTAMAQLYATLSALQQHWRRQRSFPPVHLPDPIAWFLAEADKDIVFANQVHESVTAPWDNVFKASASASASASPTRSGTRPATATTATPAVNVQYTTHGVDLGGFVVLCGALAMKVFPHVAPTERFLVAIAVAPGTTRLSSCAVKRFASRRTIRDVFCGGWRRSMTVKPAVSKRYAGHSTVS
eukprot:gene6725-4849_t